MILTFEEAVNYYSKNPDKTQIESNDLNEYELILKDNIFHGYLKLQEISRQTVALLNKDYKIYVERIFQELKKPSDSDQMSLDKIKSLASWDKSDEELHNFVKLFNHIGLFKADNETVKFENRTFSLPIIMKSVTYS